MTDMVNHPPHYKSDTGLEAISVIRAFFRDNYNLGQVFKYIARTGKKWNDLEDLKKARWYLDTEIQWRESEQVTTPEEPVSQSEAYSAYGSNSPQIGDRVQIKAAHYDDALGEVIGTRDLFCMYPYEVRYGDRNTFFAKEELWVKR